MPKILAISGSLRSGSSNTTVLQAIAALAPAGAEIFLYPSLSDLPHFNPDLDIEPAPVAIKDFRSKLQASDAVLISTPEYAHGVPGALKNALDWLVRSGEMYEKPFALINLSPRSTHAQASLVETLATMTAKLVPEACVTVALPSRDMDARAICENREISRLLSLAVAALAESTASISRR